MKQIITFFRAKDYKLTRSEIVALFNAFNRLSNSIMSKEKFRIMYQELVRKEELVLQEEKARQEHKKTVSFDASEVFILY